ncbi:HutD-family protein [Elstera litoralis]|uniref:HutD-family protein n=1 Tax=Elstera litoralis TaxID=552518 RepID=A0A0F3IVL5_9PROT|nr:HutD family protein [Elstera litoralis]KJV09634.1 HutD-family protein [Elstera litoralis]
MSVSTVTLLRAHEYRRMPWKNGGGETTEIAVFPPEADLAGFGWRVSMATVASDGPFSVFDGIDRTLLILDGPGMALTIAEEPPVVLTQTSDPLAFPADAPTSARLVGGPILDLNVMTRRGQWHHRVIRQRVQGRIAVSPGNASHLLLLARGDLRIGYGAGECQLTPLDCAVIAGDVQIETDLPTEIIRIDLTKIA